MQIPEHGMSLRELPHSHQQVLRETMSRVGCAEERPVLAQWLMTASSTAAVSLAQPYRYQEKPHRGWGGGSISKVFVVFRLLE